MCPIWWKISTKRARERRKSSQKVSENILIGRHILTETVICAQRASDTILKDGVNGHSNHAIWSLFNLVEI